MKRKEMKQILNELNKKWNLDFVSETAGNCCNSCTNFGNKDKDKAYQEAETGLIFSWFYSGVNHHEAFEETEHFYIRYDLGNTVTIDEVCNDLSLALNGRFKVIEPENELKCIELIKIS